MHRVQPKGGDANMSLIELELIEELFTSAQKEEIINQLKNAMGLIRNESLRSRVSGVHKEQAAVKN
jgi:hypothetical protein